MAAGTIFLSLRSGLGKGRGSLGCGNTKTCSFTLLGGGNTLRDLKVMNSFIILCKYILK